VNRALVYLLLMQRKNSIVAFAKGLRDPKRMLGVLFWCGLFALFLLPRGGGFTNTTLRDSAQTSLPALFSVLLLTSTVNGLLQRGLTFQLADLDFLFPAPFARRELVLYRLCTMYPLALLSSAVFLALLRRMWNDWVAAFGALLLFSFLLIHLQTTLGLVATWLEGTFVRKVRSSLRIVAWILGITCAFAFFGAATGEPRVAEWIRRVFTFDGARFVFYPALMVADALNARDLAAATPALLRLFAITTASFVLVLALQVNFLEQSFQTSQQGARARSRWGRGFFSGEAPDGDVGRARTPELALFRGAGAIVWKNLVAASRSLRFVLYAVLSIGIYTAFVVARGGRDDANSHVAESGSVLWLGAIWPLFIHQYVAFDFRRDLDNLGELKQLPARPIAVAFAEVAVPTLLALGFQFLGILGVALFEPVALSTFALAAIVYPPATLTMMTVTNLGFMLFPSRQAAAAKGRGGGSTFSLVAFFNMFATLFALAPAITAGAIVAAALSSNFTDSDLFAADLSWSSPVLRIAMAIAATQAIVAGVLLWLLGRVYARFDVSRDHG
jgi:Putative ABC exporter